MHGLVQFEKYSPQRTQRSFISKFYGSETGRNPAFCLVSDFPPGRRPLWPLRLPARRASLQLGEAGGRILPRHSPALSDDGGSHFRIPTSLPYSLFPTSASCRDMVPLYRTTAGPTSEFFCIQSSRALRGVGSTSRRPGQA
jgi:hypothetical protein